MAQPLAYTNAVAVSKNDTVPVLSVGGVPLPVQLYISTAGDLNIITVGGQTLNVAGLLAGTVFPVRVTHVKTGGTGAAVAMY